MSYCRLTYHIVFATYRRCPTIHAEHERELYQYIYGIMKRLGGFVHRIGGMPDHIHILADIPPTMTVSEFVKAVKQSSSIWMKNNRNFPHWDGWTNGFGAFSCSLSDKDRILKYIMGQKEHHQKLSFADEYKKFLIDNGIPFEEKYLP